MENGQSIRRNFEGGPSRGELRAENEVHVRSRRKKKKPCLMRGKQQSSLFSLTISELAKFGSQAKGLSSNVQHRRHLRQARMGALHRPARGLIGMDRSMSQGVNPAGFSGAGEGVGFLC